MALRVSDQPNRINKGPRGKRLYTVAEWLEMEDQPPYHELIDGVIQKMPVGTDNHSQIIFNVRTALAAYVLANQLGRVSSEVNVLIDGITGRNGWILDVVFARKDGNVKLGANWTGRPDWVAEVWAAEKQKPQRITEKRLRWQRAGVPELWEVISGETQVVMVYRLDEQGIYQVIPSEGEAICSQVIEGFCTERAAIFANIIDE